jgi:predicted nucleic acid-binding protein
MPNGCWRAVELSIRNSILSSSSSSETKRTVRRLKLAERRTRLEYRERSLLPFIGQLTSLPKLLLDTTVYVDQLQGKLPTGVEVSLRATSLWHSTVTECELSALVGLLDPGHPDTPHAVSEILASIEQRPTHRIVNPDRETWRDAGIIAGLLARLQQYGKAEQRRALNDALIFLSATKAGLAILTRNISDYDLLMQLAPQGNVVFYDV